MQKKTVKCSPRADGHLVQLTTRNASIKNWRVWYNIDVGLCTVRMDLTLGDSSNLKLLMGTASTKQNYMMIEGGHM